MEGASFGAGRAGGAVDPLEFLRRPQTVLRVVAAVRLASVPCVPLSGKGLTLSFGGQRWPPQGKLVALSAFYDHGRS
ncbi:hypothetical protein lerEdw1_008777 [Lerista edwardsae]|nr:hypothetical protein lerEdw1_008777 [Lerista edwardsae]